ncbi:MAG: class I SAM-dependent methyltransferase [Prochloraceae cyanobacterium]|nr:class I SAM-dependent methyltransferase [Prochloraceae cyanobacterium]
MSELNRPSALELFSDRTVEYANFRSDYPSAAIDEILAGLGVANQLKIADVGAGTGIAARQFAYRGAKVIAIEPNESMRKAATAHRLVEWSDGRAEATGLIENVVDLVSCFSSFHWFNSAATLSEFHRILKPSGRLAVVFNQWSDEDGLSQNYAAIVENGSQYCQQVIDRLEVKSIEESALFSQVRHREFPHYQRLDRSGLISLARSQGYLWLSGPKYEEFLVNLERLYQDWAREDGTVTLVYKTRVYLAETV